MYELSVGNTSHEPKLSEICIITSVAKAIKVLRKLRCLQIEVGIVQSLCRNDCHQVVLLGQVLEIVEEVVVLSNS